jgi:hypothetical protein
LNLLSEKLSFKICCHVPTCTATFNLYRYIVAAVMLSVMLLLLPVVRSFFRPKQGLGVFPVPTSIASAAVVPIYATFPMQVLLSELLFGEIVQSLFQLDP